MFSEGDQSEAVSGGGATWPTREVHHCSLWHHTGNMLLWQKKWRMNFFIDGYFTDRQKDVAVLVIEFCIMWKPTGLFFHWYKKKRCIVFVCTSSDGGRILFLIISTGQHLIWHSSILMAESWCSSWCDSSVWPRVEPCSHSHEKFAISAKIFICFHLTDLCTGFFSFSTVQLVAKPNPHRRRVWFWQPSVFAAQARNWGKGQIAEKNVTEEHNNDLRNVSRVDGERWPWKWLRSKLSRRRVDDADHVMSLLWWCNNVNVLSFSAQCVIVYFL